MLPAELAEERAVARVAEGVTGAAGGIETSRIEAFSERTLVARDAEYAEVIEAASGAGSRVTAAGKPTFAGVEENEADLARPRRRVRAIDGRDRHGALGRAGATEADRAGEDGVARVHRTLRGRRARS